MAHLLDASVPLLAVVVVTIGVVVHGAPAERGWELALAIPAAAALAFRRRAPTVTLAVSGGLVLGMVAVDPPSAAIGVVAPAVALFSLTLTRGRLHLAFAALAAASAVVAADAFLAGPRAHGITLQTMAHAALVAVPVLAAEALRNRRSYVQLLLERLALAERTREEEAERRAQEERLRIARDLHDVVAHTLTTINVQAGVASHLAERDPVRAREALGTIESASHDALEELRTILGVLRTPGDAPLEPAPGLDAVDALVEQARGAGSAVSLDVEGEPPRPVPEAVQLAAFRILQESLTNVRRHAPGAAARVRVAYAEDRLRLSVENDVGANGSGSPGVGILGMRERASALGGTLEAARAGGRFRVLAELPYRRGS